VKKLKEGTSTVDLSPLKRMPLEKLESAPGTWFKQARESNASTDGTHLKEKALHIAPHLGTANFSSSNPMDGSTDLTGDKTLFTEVYYVRTRVLIQEVWKTGKIKDYCKKLKIMTSVCI
jgi:hypothetical protein